MQTFLPYKNFEKSAAVLDMHRLGKQRVEVLQLLKALSFGPEQYFDTAEGVWKKLPGFIPTNQFNNSPCKTRATPWYEHPACKMWRGYENALVDYGLFMCNEWRENRDYDDTCWGKIKAYYDFTKEFVDPPWLGDEAFHAAHRSNLLRKDPEHYSQFGWTEPNDLPYVWPVK